jgi:hypothetical protein
MLSSRALNYLSTITKENALYRVLRNLLPRELYFAARMYTFGELQHIMRNLSHTSIQEYKTL